MEKIHKQLICDLTKNYFGWQDSDFAEKAVIMLKRGSTHLSEKLVLQSTKKEQINGEDKTIHLLKKYNFDNISKPEDVVPYFDFEQILFNAGYDLEYPRNNQNNLFHIHYQPIIWQGINYYLCSSNFRISQTSYFSKSPTGKR